MTYRPAFAAVLASALLLGGCGTYNGGMESLHQPVVERSDYAFDLRTAGYGLAPGEAQRLAGWMQSLGLRYGDRVSLDDGGSDAPVVREQVTAEAGRYGLLVSDPAPITPGTVLPGTVRVVVSRMTASVPSCPDHSREYQPDFGASTSSNFGCAINSNLAAMAANPGDLVRGQPGSQVADPATSGRAIRTYREARTTGAGGTVAESPSGGN